MTFSAIIAFLRTLPLTLWTILTRPAAPPAPVTVITPPVAPGAAPLVAPDIAQTLKALILSQTEAIGPMPGTGGTIHAVSPEAAELVAGLIVKHAPAYGLPVSLVASLIRSESDFDVDAIDPNDQDAKPGETPEQAAMHSDLGLAQEDVATAMGLPENAGLTLAAIESKLYDPEASVIFVCHTLADNLAWAKAALMADPSLRVQIPNGGDARVLGMQAYNSGQTGAITMARDQGLKGNWAYGLGVVARADKWHALLDA